MKIKDVVGWKKSFWGPVYFRGLYRFKEGELNILNNKQWRLKKKNNKDPCLNQRLGVKLPARTSFCYMKIHFGGIQWRSRMEDFAWDRYER